MKKQIILFGLLLLSLLGFSQKVELNEQEHPLSEIIITICEKYQLQYSLNENTLADIKVTASGSFDSPEKAFDYLLKKVPVAYSRVGDVYLFYEQQAPKEQVSYRLSGHFSDQFNSELLPYTHLSINDRGLVTDQTGSFSITANDSLFHLQASYLGYHLLDTVVVAGMNQQFFIVPTSFKLQEIKVVSSPVIRSLQVGQQPGVMRLNHQVARYLPGNGDHSVFNLLRLQPGVLAAGEQSNDLVIWGSYEGQSQILFDGMTLFAMKNFNDNISTVNPFIAKDIQVLKGAYGAEFGGRVGGMVNITGIDGDRKATRLKLSLNNMTVNGMISVPVGKKAAFTAAFRQTYYELYDSKQLIFSSGRGENSGGSMDRMIYPDYTFRDLNLKFAGTNKAGDHYGISAVMGEDRFSYLLDLESEHSRYDYEDHEHNRQLGVSAYYQKKWAGGSRTKWQVAYSGLSKEIRNLRQIGRWQEGHQGKGPGGGFSDVSNEDSRIENEVAELIAKMEHRFAVGAANQFLAGVSWVLNPVSFQQDSFDITTAKQELDGERINGYLQDAVSLSSWLNLKLGLRANYSPSLEQFFWQPRLSATADFTRNLRMNLAAGMHNQFITRSSMVDADGNYHYWWSVSNAQDVPVLESLHSLVGLTFQDHGFTFSLEAYQKHTTGLTRFVDGELTFGLYEGESKSKGLDCFVKQDFMGHSAWISYSLSQTLERFDYFETADYQRALHDQRHELKGALLLNFKAWHASASYVYGSGFPDPRLQRDDGSLYAYQRLDLGLAYSWSTQRLGLEAGVSLLNVLDYTNLKYSNFIILPEDQDVSVSLQAEAIPFTPTIFLYVSF